MAQLECKTCGIMYDCCQASIQLNGWKSVCCTMEHYQEFLRVHYEWLKENEEINKVVDA